MSFFKCILLTLALMVIVPSIMLLFATFTKIMLTICLVLVLATLIYCAANGGTELDS
jgi:hypothetical protein